MHRASHRCFDTKMKELIKCMLGLLLFGAVCSVLGFAVGRRIAQKSTESQVIRDTVTCTVLDTIVLEKPVYRYSYKTDTIHTYFTTIQHDSVLVEVPIEHKVYKEDSLYRAVVSGWKPSLDSLWIYPKTTKVTITNTVRTPAPRWSLGLTAGPSILLVPTGEIKAGMGITAGVQYRF